MRKLLLALALLLIPAAAQAQCNGVFPANTLCGNLTANPKTPGPVAAGGSVVVGPVSSTVGHFATWNNTLGTLLADYNLFGGANTWTGNNTYSTGIFNFTGTFQIGGVTVTLPIPISQGGVGFTAYTTGDIIYASNTNTLSKLATSASATRYLSNTGAANIPAWAQVDLTTGVTATLPVANGGTGNATAATHTIPINQGTAAQVNTGTGTAGQCLISNGASVDPSFASGCRVLLATLTASNSATLSDTTHFTATYQDYELVFENILPATTSTTLELQVHSAAAFPATVYLNAAAFLQSGGWAVANPTTFIQLSATILVSNAGSGVSGTVKVYNPLQTTSPKQWSGILSHPATTGNSATFMASGYWNGGNGAVDGFQVLFSSGNITSGTIKIYGII